MPGRSFIAFQRPGQGVDEVPGAHASHAHLRLGQFASYEIEGHELSGTVQEIQPSEEEKEESAQNTEPKEADGSEDDRRVVKISLPADLSFNLRPGVKATVKFALDS